ncbi:hypothetical protein [Sulfuriferula multivorans]|uniref:hypothetical protein n=1 Tax=Sulfuriferula multivorans TaxID=1559896 RepID=UPI000F5BCD3D|nr:hypothetical protein [Sulfuriferula multivorans]
MHRIGDYVRSRTDNEDGESYLGYTIAVIPVPVLLTRNLASIVLPTWNKGRVAMRYKALVAICFITVSVTGQATESSMFASSTPLERSIADNNGIDKPRQKIKSLSTRDQTNARSILKITLAYQKLHYETSFSRGCE